MPTAEQEPRRMPASQVERHRRQGRFRKDKIAEQVFYQGPSKHDKYDFPTWLR